MKHSDRGFESPVNAGLCEYYGEEVGAPASNTLALSSDRCISCGRQMDFNVYYTMCPQCGFNYRIQISSRKKGNRLSLGVWLRALCLMIGLLLVGYVVLWLSLS